MYMALEVVGGVLSGSLALLADAGHMLSDAGALALTLFAMKMAGRRPTAERTYGYYRAKILAALANGATLVAIAVFIFVDAYERFQDPPQVEGPLIWPSPAEVCSSIVQVLVPSLRPSGNPQNKPHRLAICNAAGANGVVAGKVCRKSASQTHRRPRLATSVVILDRL